MTPNHDRPGRNPRVAASRTVALGEGGWAWSLSLGR